jgi:DNA-binding MarR family transcriptional regulator
LNDEDQPGPMIGALLRIPFQETMRHVQKRLNDAGFTDLRPAHLAVFQHLPREGAHLTDLAAMAQMTKSSMGALVDHLESRGYMRRMAEPGDRRAWRVMRTEKGWAVEHTARTALSELEMHWAEHLGQDRFKALYATLQDLVAFVEPE